MLKYRKKNCTDALCPAIGLYAMWYQSVPPFPIIWILPRRKIRQVEVQVQIEHRALPLLATGWHRTLSRELRMKCVSLCNRFWNLPNTL
jgi:hypothetical protein